MTHTYRAREIVFLASSGRKRLIIANGNIVMLGFFQIVSEPELTHLIHIDGTLQCVMMDWIGKGLKPILFH